MRSPGVHVEKESKLGPEHWTHQHEVRGSGEERYQQRRLRMGDPRREDHHQCVVSWKVSEECAGGGDKGVSCCKQKYNGV